MAQANILAGGVPGGTIRCLCGERESETVNGAQESDGDGWQSRANSPAPLPHLRADGLGRLCAGAARPAASARMQRGGKGRDAAPRSLCTGSIGGGGGAARRAQRGVSGAESRQGGPAVELRLGGRSGAGRAEPRPAQDIPVCALSSDVSAVCVTVKAVS